jgi:hypothetical protein
LSGCGTPFLHNKKAQVGKDLNSIFNEDICKQLISFTAMLKGQSHEKVGEMSVWGIRLGPN